MELTVEQALQRAVAAHKEGKLQDAERLYRAILQSQPAHPDANHNLGVLAVSVDKRDAALPFFKAALEANPKIEQFWLSFIDALIKTKAVDDARRVLTDAQQAGINAAKLQIFEKQLEVEILPSRQVPQQDINDPPHSHEDNLSPAIHLREVGKLKEAQEWLSNLIEHDSKNAEALSLLSQVLLMDKKEAEAERALKAASSINPQLPSVYRNQARLLLKQSKEVEALEKAQLGRKQSPEDLESLLVLAACLGANKRDSESLRIVEEILKARPNYAEAYANRALAKFRARDVVGAIQDAKMALSLKPHFAQMWQLLSSLYYQNSRLDDAIEALKSALEIEPENKHLMIQVGELLRQNNKASEAITILEQATELAPKDTNAWTNLGVALQQEEKIADAKIVYEKALTLNPKLAAVLSNLGVMAKDAEEWESALTYFERALEIDSNLVEVHNNLGVTFQALGRLDEAEASLTQAIALKPDYAEAHSNLGVTYCKIGKLNEAVASYRQVIALKPDFANAYYSLGNTLRELEKLDEAEASYARAITLKPDHVEAHINMGVTLRKLGRLDEAVTSYGQVIALKPNYANAHFNLGNTLRELGRLGEAESSYKQAAALRPDYAEIHSNLGVTLQELERLDEAEASYARAIALKPDYADAHINLGVTLHKLGRLDEAVASYRKATALKPDYAKVHRDLGATLREVGRLDEALESYARAIALKPDYADAYVSLGLAIKNVKFKTSNRELYPALTKLLTIGNFSRPSEVAGSISSLLKNDPLINELLLEKDVVLSLPEVIFIIKRLNKLDLLHHLMHVSPLPDLEFEEFFVTMRRFLLMNLGRIKASPDLIYFLTTLSLHCFTNEYVYFESDEEVCLVEELADAITQTVAQSEQPEAINILCLASYRALHQYDWSQKLRALDNLKEVKKRLIEEPLIEKMIMKKIPALEAISDVVSHKVRKQYEENPYPRWERLGISLKAQSISEVCDRSHLNLHSESIKTVTAPTILIAGCGTGQHSIGTASRFSNCHVTAVDLSVASLAYAQRKTKELCLANLNYLQADILHLYKLSKKFDIIESLGVLHHMSEPMTGWRVLVDLLKSGGLMKIGLYSELARQHIVEVRKEITLRNVGTSEADIRSFRRSLVESHDENHQLLTKSADFFSLSSLRDLIFHVQEHRFTLPRIQDCLNELGLKFCGFENRDLISKFREFHGRGVDIHDLVLWHQYEENNPWAFAGMYQFWCQRP